jgi:hypothetical protein
MTTRALPPDMPRCKSGQNLFTVAEEKRIRLNAERYSWTELGELMGRHGKSVQRFAKSRCIKGKVARTHRYPETRKPPTPVPMPASLSRIDRMMELVERICA